MFPHSLSLMIILPFLGAIFQILVPAHQNGSGVLFSKWVGFLASALSSCLGIALVLTLEPDQPGLQISDVLPWIGSYSITYNLGLDGLNIVLVLLISILFPILIASEWEQKTGGRGMHSLFLLLQSALLGAVISQDLFLLFFFWAFCSLPLYFLLGVWGGEQRERAAFISIATSSIGNALLFSSLVLIYYSVDPHTFSIKELMGGKLVGKTIQWFGAELSVPSIAFILIGTGLALRAPIWPFHGWYSNIADEAPPSVFVVVSAITIQVAVYIMIRICYSLFPETIKLHSQTFVTIGVLNLILGGICAVSQKELKRLLAYLSVSQLGIVLIGVGSLSPLGLVGAVYQQLVLGLGLAGFGFFYGLVCERTGHSKFITSGGEKTMGGLATQAPAIAIMAGIMIGSLLGFPGFGGFIGHSLVLIGSYTVHPFVVLLAGGALLLSAYYLFSMYHSVFLGPQGSCAKSFPDLTLRERAYFFPLVAFLILFGLYPKPLLDLMRPTILSLLAAVK